MSKLLTTSALTLALLVASAGWAQAQNTGSSESGASSGQSTSSGASNDQGGTTGTMTTTPQDKSDDAAGTRGEDMKEGCAPGQTPVAGQKC